MSPAAKRFFGCFFPLVIAVFGCGLMVLIGYSGRIFLQVLPVENTDMGTPFVPGRTFVASNAYFWTAKPSRGMVVTVRAPDRSVKIRRIIGLPEDTLQVTKGKISVTDPEKPGQILDLGTALGPDIAPLTLKLGEYYVWADRRTDDDSRDWGPVSGRQILGVITAVNAGGSRPLAVRPGPASIVDTNQ